MYRGARPHRGGYHPPPSRGFGPRPGPRHHSPSDPYRRPSPRRRYSSPGARDEPRDYRGEGRPQGSYRRYSPSPPRGGLPVDHSLVITVGNELTNPADAPYVRDYGAGDYKKPYYSPRRSSYDDHSDRGSRRRSVSRGRSRGRSPSPGYPRSKSRPRSRSRSRSPERSKSRARSKSRVRGRSYSRSRSRSGSRGRRQSRARSRARSKSRQRSRSRERSHSRGRSRGRSRSVSHSGSSSSSSSSKSSRSSSRSRYSRSVRPGEGTEDFTELEKARRRKEIQNTLVQPAKSILKKRMDSSETDSPMVAQNSDSPRANPDGGLSHEAEQLLSALTKTMDPELMASMLGKCSDSSALEELLGKLQSLKEGGIGAILPHEKEGRQEKSDLVEFIGMMAEMVGHSQNVKKSLTDIEDEEKFLYGDEVDEDDSQMKPTKDIPTESSFPDTRFPQSHDVPGGEHSTTPYMFGRAEDDNVNHSQADRGGHTLATPEVHGEEPSDFPPGVGPQDVKVRKEVEEYEKIQDLLKTIGLDLGVAEISKMAVRTQERLHGKSSVKKTPVRRQSERKHRSRSRSYSSSSSGSSRSKSSSRSRSRSYKRNSGRSCKKPVSPEPKRSSRSRSQSKNESQPTPTQGVWPTTPTAGPGPPVFPPRPNLPAHPMPYPPPPPHGVMPPDYPPHGYDPYGNYVPYMPPGWPMYPPPGMPVPPHNPMDPYNLRGMERPFLKVIATGTTEGKDTDKKVPTKTDAVASKPIISDSQRRAMEDKNTASQKQKVLEELEKLKEDKEIRMKRKGNLMKEVETLRRQHGELLRKKRREKDGHKDPVLIDLGKLQEDAMTELSKLRAEERESDKKHEELVKVALILGIDYKESKFSADRVQSKRESTRSPEKSGASTSSNKAAPSGASPEKLKSSTPSRRHSTDSAGEQFEYYDAGNHWCKNCNVTSGSMFDFFMHLHSKVHRKTLDPYDRPWAKSESDKKHGTGEKTSKPAKGSEFLIPVRGFFCQLCEEFFGDPICAEAHVTRHAHNEKYKGKMYENPLYEQRRNLDRQAGLKSHKNSDHKRKREDSDQDDVKKSKHSKDGKKTISVEKEEKPHYSKDEEYKNIKESDNKFKEERLKYKKEDVYKQKYKEDDERAKIKKEEEERAKYKKEEEERHRVKKEEEYTNRYRKEEVERSRYEEDRYRNKDDYDRYKYREEDDRNRFRKDDDRDRYSREDERSKYGRDEEKKYKYTREVEEKSAKYKDEEWVKWPKSKWEDPEDSDDKKDQKGKAAYSKDDKESKEKSSSAKDVKAEPPKVLCGPSPALLAKLRKKNEESAARSGFGKFTRKKPQKTALEKEAERMAAQFMKEDEESVPKVDEVKAEIKVENTDPFTKSIAAAKSIAMKLSGKPVLPPSNEWLAFNENKSNPNLPPPSSPLVIRKSFGGVQNKPAPPVPGSQTQNHPALSADLISKAFSGEEVQLKNQVPSAKPIDIFDTSVPLSSSTAASKPENDTKIKPFTSSEFVFTLDSDVAAPGVPEAEQNLTVILRPPPQFSSSSKDLFSKTAKPKTLAAGKAKDLFDIFYSGSTTVKSSVNTTVGDKQDFGYKPPDNDSRSKTTVKSNESNYKDKTESHAEQVKEPPKNQDSEVAQKSQESIKNQDSEVARSEEPHKNQNSTVAQSKDAPMNENSEVLQSNEQYKNEDLQVQQASENSNSKSLIEPENLLEDKDKKEEESNEQQLFKTTEISQGDSLKVEVYNVDTKKSLLESEQNPLESEAMPLESEQNPLESEQNPLESEAMPLESEQNPLESEAMPLKSEAMPLESEQNPLESEAMSLESEQNPLESEAMPLESEAMPLESEQNPLESEAMPLESEAMPLESEAMPLESEAMPLESEQNPLESEAMPLEFEQNPLESEAVPLESAQIPLESEITPLESEITPLESEITPLESEITPLESEITPLESQITPLESQITPLESQITPLESEITPLESQITPLESQITPLESQITPLESEVIPVQPEIIPVQPEVVPVQPEVVPVQPEVVPVQPEVIPVQPEVIPVQPEVIPVQPEVIPVEPEVISVDPEIISVDPDVISVEPDVIPLEPDVIPLEPDIIPLEPDIIPMEPDIILLEPEGIPLEPEGIPLESEENPLESEEPMSFSPLTGSLTEQLNLDTFEFNFEPL
nr:zinc finger protein 318 isoform X2 [Misgurnus anguillicaudatus]